MKTKETAKINAVQTALSYVNLAKHRLGKLEDSNYKKSLNCLVDYIIQ